LTEESATNNTFTAAGTSQSLTLTALNPYYDFKPTLGTLTLPTNPITSGDGQLIRVPVIIQNLGNVTTTAGTSDVVITITKTTDTTNTSDTIATVTGVNYGGLAPGAKRTLTLTASVPIGFDATYYKLGVTLNPLATIPESNPTNNTATSSQNLHVTTKGLPDLTGKLTSDTLLPYIITGATASGTVTLTMTNQGNVKLPLNQKVDIQIIAHDNNTANGTTADTVIGSISGYNASSMVAGAVKTIPVRVTIPGSLPADDYILEARIIPQDSMSESNTANNLLTATLLGQHLTLTSAPQFNNVSGNLVSTNLPTAKAANTAISGTMYVTVSNLSNLTVPSGTRIQLTLIAHTATRDITLGTASASISLLGIGKSTGNIAVPARLPGGLTTGNYTLEVLITAPTLTESTTADNLITSTKTGGSLTMAIT
jgi:hypothetical protein